MRVLRRRPLAWNLKVPTQQVHRRRVEGLRGLWSRSIVKNFFTQGPQYIDQNKTVSIIGNPKKVCHNFGKPHIRPRCKALAGFTFPASIWKAQTQGYSSGFRGLGMFLKLGGALWTRRTKSRSCWGIRSVFLRLLSRSA